MKDFDLDDILNLPEKTVINCINNLYIVLASEYPNWLVLDENELKFFNGLLVNNIKDAMLSLRDNEKIEEGLVISIAQRVLSKIENAQFYANAEVREEIPMKEITKSIHINLTNDCNLRCKHCYMSAGFGERLELDKDKLIVFIEEITKLNGKTEVVLSGGEPFLYRNLFDIIIECKKMGHKVVVFTNGLLINKSNIDFIKKCVYRNIRTAIPETSGHETGGIRTLCRLI